VKLPDVINSTYRGWHIRATRAPAYTRQTWMAELVDDPEWTEYGPDLVDTIMSLVEWLDEDHPDGPVRSGQPRPKGQS